jgi:stage II sporulation protein AA (anti-sigma F factor antagonist)
MDMVVEELADGVTRASLNGRMDIDGARAVDTQFNILAGVKMRLIVDMAEVSFIASMGLRTLMTCARAITSKGGKMAIAGARDNVSKVLTTSGVDQVIPVTGTFDAALAATAG